MLFLVPVAVASAPMQFGLSIGVGAQHRSPSWTDEIAGRPVVPVLASALVHSGVGASLGVRIGARPHPRRPGFETEFLVGTQGRSARYALVRGALGYAWQRYIHPDGSVDVVSYTARAEVGLGLRLGERRGLEVSLYAQGMAPRHVEVFRRAPVSQLSPSNVGLLGTLVLGRGRPRPHSSEL